METEVLWNILAKPEDAKYAFTLNVQSLVDQYPQSGIFRALLAANGDEANVAHAAVRFNPAVLYRLIYAPESLPVVNADQIYQFDEPLAIGETSVKTPPPESKHEAKEPSGDLYEQLNIKRIEHDDFTLITHEEDDDAVNQDIDAVEGKEADNFTFEPIAQPADAEETYDNPWQEKEIAEPTDAELVTVQAAPAEEPVANKEPVQEVSQTEAVAQAPAPVAEPELTPLSEQTEFFHQDIDDEIYDEIVSIDDIGLEIINSYKPSDYAAEEEKVNSTQHFVFDREYSGSDETESAQEQPQQAAPIAAVHHEEIEDIHPYVQPVIVPANEVMVLKRGVAQYDNEKLPYSFMWWLDKTRQEHSGTYAYRPYADDHKRYQQYQQQNPNVKINTDTASGRDLLDELQIQYVENIYTLNAVDDLEKRVAPVLDELQSKEDKIIDRFIKTEPHIKPPGEVKLDNENKAKRSSEDGDELITETLARIYSEQMLYSKAIAAYKKLMLKYPEKSLYFAGQIEQLEKKPN